MRVSILRFNEMKDEYEETEIPIDILKDNDDLLFPVTHRGFINCDKGDKPIEFYVKIYKD